MSRLLTVYYYYCCLLVFEYFVILYYFMFIRDALYLVLLLFSMVEGLGGLARGRTRLASPMEQEPPTPTPEI